eukprot:CAMPEP_0117436730 /NCGR_PEP_ID=MMETSP0759-20121206/1157_1 /TAXON_ID=63605 /ORGANISM="Percolomonas cosmopolitus, Strain WS" /LENGTH=1022 /DNA_ID=CAMNT_0005228337 /DNA_START=507 /DNA_END=3575 /DNA_ORIENTATION=+
MTHFQNNDTDGHHEPSFREEGSKGICLVEAHMACHTHRAHSAITPNIDQAASTLKSSSEIAHSAPVPASPPSIVSPETQNDSLNCENAIHDVPDIPRNESSVHGTERGETLEHLHQPNSNDSPLRNEHDTQPDAPKSNLVDENGDHNTEKRKNHHRVTFVHVESESTESSSGSLTRNFSPSNSTHNSEATQRSLPHLTNGFTRQRSISVKVDARVFKSLNQSSPDWPPTNMPSRGSPGRKRSYTRKLSPNRGLQHLYSLAQTEARQLLNGSVGGAPSPDLNKIAERNKNMLEGIHIFLTDDDLPTDMDDSLDFETEADGMHFKSSRVHQATPRNTTRTEKPSSKDNLRTELNSLFKVFDEKQERFRKKSWKRQKQSLLSIPSSANLSQISSSSDVDNGTCCAGPNKAQCTRILSRLTELSSVLRKFRLKEVSESHIPISGSNMAATPLDSQFLPNALISSVASTLRELDHYLARDFFEDFQKRASSESEQCAFLTDVLRKLISFISLVGKIFTLQSWIVHIVTGILRLDRQLTYTIQKKQMSRGSTTIHRVREMPVDSKVPPPQLVVEKVLSDSVLPSPDLSAQQDKLQVYSLPQQSTSNYDIKPNYSSSHSGANQPSTATKSFLLYKDFIVFTFRHTQWAGEEGFRAYFEALLNFMTIFIWQEADDRPYQVFTPPMSTSSQVTQYNQYLVYGHHQSDTNPPTSNGGESDDLTSPQSSTSSCSGETFSNPEFNHTHLFHHKDSHSCKAFGKAGYYHNTLSDAGRFIDQSPRRMMKILKCKCARNHAMNDCAEYGIRFCYKQVQNIQRIIGEYMWRKEGRTVCRLGLLLMCSCFLYNQPFSRRSHMKISKLQNENMVWTLMKFYTDDFELIYYSLLLINFFIEEDVYSCTTKLKTRITENVKSNIVFFVDNVLMKIPAHSMTESSIVQNIQHEAFKFLLYLCNKNAHCKQFILTLPNRDNVQLRVETMIHRNRSLGHKRNVALEVSSVEFWTMIHKPVICSHEDLWEEDMPERKDKCLACTVS